MQAPPPGAANPTDLGAAAASPMREAGSFFSQGEFTLTLILFTFGVIAIAAFYMLARSDKGTPFIMRIYVIIVIVFGTLLIVSSSYTTQQIAPVVGLFGTIAGYLLGRSDRGNE
jgi:hydrogenase/urease accessory protein HupE